MRGDGGRGAAARLVAEDEIVQDPSEPPRFTPPLEGGEDGVPSDDGRRWRRVIAGADGVAVCAFDAEGRFHLWASARAVAEAAFEALEREARDAG